jgi:ABC-type siderophore export system fused ATPase/permease subunit
VIRWVGTALCMIGMALTSLNIYPYNLYFSCIGSLLWCITAIRWNDNALAIVEAAAVVIYIVGILRFILF